ncbi:uncharacterized protein LOC132243804 [Alligator mississippiensis]|uniref:uncharacterized protein LOC132243804 n=1 Tax=Alligator mississippiensis TaxID=8496 RepID=UPI0028778708|nr:uncharacterized protein LOC132243804 [Alligator mississippiensis]
MEDEYVRMTVPELKELAKERGLHVKKGLKKEELIKLLCTSESEPASASRSSSPGPDSGPPSRSSSPEAARRSLSEREQQRLHEREMKRMELEEKRLEQEAQREKEQIELKRLELEAQRQREKEQIELKRMELEERRLEREARLEAQKLEAQLHLQTIGGNANPPQASGEQPKLDVSAFARYREGDDPAVFLSNFERQAQRCKVPEEKIMMYLSALVEGDMAVVLNSLPSDAADDYNAFKAAVSKRFQLGPEYFRKKFRNTRPQPGKSLTDFGVLLEDTYIKWLAEAKADTAEKSRQLLVLEQFYYCCPTEVKTLVRDRDPKNVHEAAEIADRLLLNREKPPYSGKEQKGFQRGGKGGPGQKGERGPPPAERKAAPDSNKPPNSEKRGCYNCGEQGHIKPNCPKLSTRPRPVRRATAVSSEGEGRSPSEESVCCYRITNSEEVMAPHRTMITVKGRTLVGELDTGASVTLISSNLVSPADIIPGKTLTIHGVGSAPQKVPVFCAPIVWNDCATYLEMGVLEGAPAPILVGRDLIEQEAQLRRWEQIQEPKPRTVHAVTRLQSRKAKEGGLGNPREKVTPLATGEGTPADGDCTLVPEGTGNPEGGLSDSSGEACIPSVAEGGDTSREETQEVPVGECALPADCLAGQEEFKQEVWEDPSLEGLRQMAQEQETEFTPDKREQVVWDKGLLYRLWVPKNHAETREPQRQLIVPQKYRQQLLALAHDLPCAGHMGRERTRQRLQVNFFWPRIAQNVTDYCKSCETCQRTGKSGDKRRAPLQPLPIIDQPFHRVAVDIVGPLKHRTRRGKKYILTLVDYATRYPEAVALTSIEAPVVADALIKVFCQLGFPSEILTDRGGNFMAEVMECLWDCCGVQHLKTTAYHPQTNGLVERFNGTLKGMLKAYVDSNPNDWDEKLPHLLFAYREVPQESTGFSPFELMFGRRVRGPLDLVREEWEGKIASTKTSVVECVLDFRQKLTDMMKVARDSLGQAQEKQRSWYDEKARLRTFERGENVMVFLPLKTDKLQAAWEGPHAVLDRLDDVTYVVGIKGRKPKTIHVNMLKPYYDRKEMVFWVPSIEGTPEDPEEPVMYGDWDGEAGIEELRLPDHLPSQDKDQLLAALKDFETVFSNKPGRTDLAVHSIETGSHRPIYSRHYPVNEKVRQEIEREIAEMEELGVIRPSTSPWASPVVLVRKQDGTIRFCVDYRKLNAITTPDAYPMPRMDTLLDRLGPAKVISTLDLSKGFWQMALDPDAIAKSAFTTPTGLYEFTVLPFGLRNSPASFQRLINNLLQGCEQFAMAYIDDIAIFSPDFESHLTHLTTVLGKIKQAGLTVKAKKCQWALSEVVYLGHRVGGGHIAPLWDKIEAIKDWPPPQTKKQVRAFLGLAGYYRRLVPGFGATAAPLHELTKKGSPDPVVWKQGCQEAFDTLKAALVKQPILKAPLQDKPFYVATDASDVGLGAVLLQEHQETRHPVVYLSRKLIPRERNLSSIEKECLAIVWALNKLKPYLWGQQFTVLSDHAPLQWLQTMHNTNAKLQRWSWQLQEFNFTVQHIKGSQNVIADALSRKDSG